MCILFMYNAFNDPESEYSLILATNRDEFFDRNAQNMAPWKQDNNIFGGIDLGAECLSSWMAYSSSKEKLGLLLNYPDVKKENPKIEFWNNQPLIQTYNNATNKLQTWTECCVGFSNNLPDNPLTKVKSGKDSLRKICEEYKTVQKKLELIDKLIDLLKSKDRHLPDPILEKRRPSDYQWFSSIFVCIPHVRYGTRTHTLMLVTKTGQIDLIEITMESPINLSNPVWKRSDFKFNLKKL